MKPSLTSNKMTKSYPSRPAGARGSTNQKRNGVIRIKALHNNIKTYRSMDFSTNCPKRRAGNPCSYCYVETARKQDFRGKTVVDYIPYNGEIKRLKKTTIDKLNRCGGLRLFSFGDYMPEMDEDIFAAIKDAQEVGLHLKAITKQVDFVPKFYRYMRVINVSVDALGEGVSHEIAKNLRDTYPNVLVRAAIMKEEDIWELNWSDIFTFNHAHNGYQYFSPKQIKEYAKMFPGKVCCETGRCETCVIKCGQPKNS